MSVAMHAHSVDEVISETKVLDCLRSVLLAFGLWSWSTSQWKQTKHSQSIRGWSLAILVGCLWIDSGWASIPLDVPSEAGGRAKRFERVWGKTMSQMR